MRSGAAHPLQIALGLAIWLAWFGAVYGGLAVGCALAPPAGAVPGNWLNAVLAAVSVAVAALLFGLAGFCWRAAPAEAAGERRFIARLAACGHLVAALGVVFVAWPLARLPPCL